MEEKTTTIQLDLMTVAEAALYVGVSVRTIERHVLLGNCPTEWTARNNRKVKAYPKYWLDRTFVKNDIEKKRMSDSQHDKQTRQDIGTEKMSDKNDGIKSEEVITALREDVGFLRKEIDVKNQQITALIKSEEQTKTLLADLQMQNKNLQLNSPQAKQKPQEKESRIWLWLGIILIAGLLTGSYFCYEYVAALFVK